jgi:hypothetical protein
MSYDPNAGGTSGESWQQPGYQQQPQGGGYQQPAYGQPQYQQGYGQPQYGGGAPKADGMAIGALVSSIVGLLLCFCFVGIIGSIVGVVLGFLSKKRIRESNGQLTGDGMATAGIALGGVGIALLIIYIIWVAVSGGFYWSYG